MKEMTRAVQNLETIIRGKIKNPRTKFPKQESARLEKKAFHLLSQEDELGLEDEMLDTGLEMLSKARDLKHRFCYQAHKVAAGQNIIDAQEMLRSLDQDSLYFRRAVNKIEIAVDLFELGKTATTLKKSIYYFRTSTLLSVKVQDQLSQSSQSSTPYF